MATSKSLHKVQKQISKKRGGKLNSLHENSRDSQRLRRAGAREDKIAKVVAAASRANQTYGTDEFRSLVGRDTHSILKSVDRVAFFQSSVEESTTPISEEELRVLTVRWVNIRPS